MSRVLGQNWRNSIEQAIAFFDMFDYPLTKEEVWRFLYYPSQAVSPEEVNNFLVRNLPADLESQDGFYFLPNRAKIIEIRKERERISHRKHKKARRIARIFSWLPFVQMVALVNFLPPQNTRAESDLDFLIIVKKNRLWLTRFLTIFLAAFLGGRPTPQNQQDKICLTFFLSEKALDLKGVALGNDDVYFHYWLVNVWPLVNKNQTYEKFMAANKWVRKYLPNAFPLSKFRTKSQLSNKKSNVDFLKPMELGLKRIQLKKMPAALKKIANQDTRVIITDKILKFHLNDRRDYFRQQFKKRIKV